MVNNIIEFIFAMKLLSFVFFTGDSCSSFFQIPLIVPLLAFLASASLVIVPIVTDPRVEFLYAVVLIAVGLIFWLPFVHLKVNLILLSKSVD